MEPQELSQGRKFLIDLFPLAAFFGTNWFYKGSNQDKLLWATGILVLATLISLAITFVLTKKLSKMLLFTAAIVTLFGGLTLYFKDPIFIQRKVTIINALFGLLLFGGLYFKQNFIKSVLGQAMELPENAWYKLAIRWGCFFFAMAALNEIVLKFAPDYWVSFKAFGLLALTIVFAIANAPFMARHMKDEDDDLLKPSGD
jgi:intracellular septation protein